MDTSAGMETSATCKFSLSYQKNQESIGIYPCIYSKEDITEHFNSNQQWLLDFAKESFVLNHKTETKPSIFQSFYRNQI